MPALRYITDKGRLALFAVMALLLAAPAAAEPVTSFVAIVVAVGEVIVKYAYAYRTYLYIAALAITARNLSNRGERTLGASERFTTLQTPDAPRRILYGTAQYAPPIVYADSKDENDTRFVIPFFGGSQITFDGARNIVIVYALSDHGLDEVEEIHANGGRLLTHDELDDLNAGRLVNLRTAPDNTAEVRRNAHQANSDDHDGSVRSQVPDFMQLVLSKTGDGDFASRMDGHGLDFMSRFPNWTQAGMRAEGISWLAVIFRNPTDDRRYKNWNSIPQITVRARRGAHGMVGAELFGVEETYYTGTFTGEASSVTETGYEVGEIDGERVTQWRAHGTAISNPTFTLPGVAGEQTLLEAVQYARSFRLSMSPLNEFDALAGLQEIGLKFEVTNTDTGEVIVPPTSFDDANPTHAAFVSIPQQQWWFPDVFPDTTDRLDGVNFTVRIFTGAESDTPDPTNVAWAMYDYVTKYTTYGDRVLGVDRIDTASFQTTYAAADMQGNKCNGVLELTDSPDAVIEEMVFAGAGMEFLDVGGICHCRPAVVPESSITLTHDDVLEGWAISPESPRVNRVEAVSTRYIHQDDSTGNDIIESVTTSLPNVDVEDARVLDISSAFIRDRDQAERISQLTMQRINNGFRVSLVCNARALPLRPSDTCRLSLPTLGINDRRLFRVQSSEIQPDMSVKLDLQEEVEELYDLLGSDYRIAYTPTVLTTSEFNVNTGSGNQRLCINADDSLSVEHG